MYGQDCTIMGRLLENIKLEKKKSWDYQGVSFRIAAPRRKPFNREKVEIIPCYYFGPKAVHALENYGKTSLLRLQGEFLTSTKYSKELRIKLSKTVFCVYPEEWAIQCIEQWPPKDGETLLAKEDDENYTGFMDKNNAVFDVGENKK